MPRWWGVWLASPDLDSPTGVVLTVEREALDNPRFNRLAQAKLLQKAELRPLLHGMPSTSVERMTRAMPWLRQLRTNSRSGSWRRRSCTRSQSVAVTRRCQSSRNKCHRAD